MIVCLEVFPLKYKYLIEDNIIAVWWIPTRIFYDIREYLEFLIIENFSST